LIGLAIFVGPLLLLLISYHLYTWWEQRSGTRRLWAAVQPKVEAEYAFALACWLYLAQQATAKKQTDGE
jgi:phosphoglycerate-specific signal transduction histidine kinase